MIFNQNHFSLFEFLGSLIAASVDEGSDEIVKARGLLCSAVGLIAVCPRGSQRVLDTKSSVQASCTRSNLCRHKITKPTAEGCFYHGRRSGGIRPRRTDRSFREMKAKYN